jgi:cell division protein FtsQ
VPGEVRIPAGTDSAVAVLPRPETKRRIDLARIVPSGRATVITLIVIALATGAYLLARESSLFAVETIDVRGASGSIAGQIRAALADFENDSLVTLDGSAVERRLLSLPIVAAARYDRDFPHTLRIIVRPERPVAVVRRGAESWLVSARARVISTLQRGEESKLPRIWLRGPVSVSPGGTLAGDPARGVKAAAPLGRSPLRGRVATIRSGPEELSLILRSGIQVELANAQNLPLKLAVAAKIAAIAPRGGGYIDLTVPNRPVSKTQP